MFKLIDLGRGQYKIMTTEKSILCSKKDAIAALLSFGVSEQEVEYCFITMEENMENIAVFGINNTVVNFEGVVYNA